jgi:hypothetical protein
LVFLQMSNDWEQNIDPWLLQSANGPFVTGGPYYASSNQYPVTPPTDIAMNNNVSHPAFSGNLIYDDDLEATIDREDGPGSGLAYDFNSTGQDPGFFQNNGMNIGTSAAGLYSHTPNDQPIASPFMNSNFNYAQYGSMMNGFNGRKMPGNQFEGRAPMTPNTPGMAGLPMGTPESLSHQAMLNQQLHNAAKINASEQWSGTPGSGSWSPLNSPTHHFGHQTIPEVLHGKGVASKLEGAQSASLPPSLQSQEAKKKRRRESHNLVERRRRDNINERIQDLARIVPLHRLQDEALRKHIQANGAISSATGNSPPSGMTPTGAPGRRTTPGTITQGLPHEEKEKGPNKGDILNGAVSWTRDLMWLLYRQQTQMLQLREYVENLGGEWPLSQTEEEARMSDELISVVQKVGFGGFQYSRGHGTGLYVPHFTDIHGDNLNASERQKSLSQAAASLAHRTGDDDGIKNDPGSVGSTNFDAEFYGIIKEEDDGMYGMDIS